MQEELKPLLVTIITVFCIICGYIIISPAGIIPELSINQSYGDAISSQISGTATVGQSFFSQDKNLREIDLLVSAPGGASQNDVIFHLQEVDSRKEIVKKRLKASTFDFQNNRFYPISFGPIENSNNKTYTFYLESPDGIPHNAIAVYYNPKDVYGVGSMTIDSIPKEGDIVFKTYNLPKNMTAFDWLSTFVWRFSQDWIFAIFYILCLFLLVVGIYRFSEK